MRRTLPPFPALCAFEAAARLGSFRAAGEELCVTSSAISHQIRKLEEFVGEPLFAREKLGPCLNEAGTAYLEKVSPVLDELECHTSNLFHRDVSNIIRVKGTPGFLARWLVPRLDRLRAATGLEVKMTSGLPPTDFSTCDVDVIIHWGDEPVAGAVVEPFLATPKVVVASPEYLRKVGPINSPDDLPGCCLLRDEVGDLWHEWLEIAGANGTVRPDGPILAHCELVLTAAERAQGIALAYEAMVEQDLEDGRLVKLFPQSTDDTLIYSVSYPNTSRTKKSILKFRDWVFSEVAEAPFRHDLKIAAE